MSFAPASLPWLQIFSLATAWHMVQGVVSQSGVDETATGNPSPSVRQLLRGFRRGALTGWIYGFAMFVVGVCWLYISLHEFGEVPAVIAGLAVVALAAYMGLFPAFALGVAGLIMVALRMRLRFNSPAAAVSATPFSSTSAPPPSPLAWGVTAVVAAMAWALSEWLRAVVFTGFPWLATGEAWVDTPLAGFYPLAGSYGVAFLVALAAFLLSGVSRRLGPAFASVAAFCLAAGLAGETLKTHNWGQEEVATVRVHLVQPDVSQTIKFDPDHITRNFLDTIMLGRRAAEDSAPGDWLMFPETALPVLWQEAPARWRDAFAELAFEYQVPVVMGAALQDGHDIYTNSVIALLPEQMRAPEQPALRYDKRHLVPFGEFIPPGFRWFVDFMNMPLGDFTRGRGSPVPFKLGALRVLPNVCYEDVFGQEMAHLVRSATDEPNVLFNVSNLAWFGGSWALEQHGQMSRVRAAELRKPMVRATNTGISGVINARGDWVMRMPDNERAVASAEVVGTRGLTPFATHGLGITVVFVLTVSALFLLMACLLAFAAGRRGDVQ